MHPHSTGLNSPHDISWPFTLNAIARGFEASFYGPDALPVVHPTVLKHTIIITEITSCSSVNEHYEEAHRFSVSLKQVESKLQSRHKKSSLAYYGTTKNVQSVSSG